MELKHRISLFKNAIGFEGLEDHQIREIGELSFVRHFRKGATVFNENEVCRHFYLVAQGAG